MSISGGETKFRLRYTTGDSNLRAHIKWLKQLAEIDQFSRLVNRKLKQSRALATISSTAKDIVQDKVYNAYPDPGTRTDRLYRSTKSVSTPITADSMGGWAIFMDPNIAPIKRPGNIKSPFNYAAFFLKPAELGTFIKSSTGERGQKEKPRTFRDFFGVEETDDKTFLQFMAKFTPPIVAKSIIQAVRENNPSGHY